MPQKIEFHKFQLVSLDIRELSILSLVDNIKEKKEVSNEIEGSFQTGRGFFNEENKNIVAGIKFEINPEKDKEKAPFSLVVEIVGVFKFKEDEEFKEEDINKWVEMNSIYLLFPYLREQVYSLTQRAGFNPTILPLISLPGTPKFETSSPN